MIKNDGVGGQSYFETMQWLSLCGLYADTENRIGCEMTVVLSSVCLSIHDSSLHIHMYVSPKFKSV